MINAHERLLQQAQAEQKTDAFKSEYRKRPMVERKIAEVVRHGMRQARYIGRVKVELQLIWISAVVNLKRIFRHISETTMPKSAANTLCTA